MFSSLKKVTVIGVGGGAAYYVAKVLSLLKIPVDGYDQKDNEHTNELVNLGANIRLQNPDSWSFPESDLILYTTALPQRLQDQIFAANPNTKTYDVGTFYDMVVAAYARGEFNEAPDVLSAIRESNIAPLYDIDFGKTILIGVTGSKGKTTTSQMLYDTLTMLGKKVSLISTIGGKILDEKIETGLHTSTPSAQELAVLFKKMLEKESEIIVVESSSHAIATGRISGLKFDYAVLTNVQPEHLDFHKTLEHVLMTKMKLVTTYLKPDCGVAIVNIDDENIREKVYPELYKYATKVFTISQEGLSFPDSQGYVTKNLVTNESSISFDLQSVKDETAAEYFEVPFAGAFNATNVFASIIIARELGLPNIPNVIAKLHPVDGRNEVLQTVPFKAVLDFAHTPESLEAILKTYRTLPSTNRVIVVFGTAGQRDTVKRPRMGAAAAQYADITILTAEDPRTEKLSEINDAIEQGWRTCVSEQQLQDKRTLYRFDDASIKEAIRTEAIRKAFSLAQPGDVVICAGKGPEKSLCFETEERPWNEKEVMLRLLNEPSDSNA